MSLAGIKIMSKDIDFITEEIEKLRSVLNEICISIDDEDFTEKILAISMDMDKLILDYVKHESDLKLNRYQGKSDI